MSSREAWDRVEGQELFQRYSHSVERSSGALIIEREVDSMKYVGIDLAGSPRRPTGFCSVDERKNVQCSVLGSDDEIIVTVRKSRAKVVAIDAPLALPKGRHCVEEHCRWRPHFRACDRALGRMRIRGFPVTIGPMRMLTKRGISLAENLRGFGLVAIETFPGAAQDILHMPRKQHNLAGLQESLVKLGLKGDVRARSLTGDELDAISCALVAMDYAKGSYLAIGDPSEIMMILPRVEE